MQAAQVVQAEPILEEMAALFSKTEFLPIHERSTSWVNPLPIS